MKKAISFIFWGAIVSIVIFSCGEKEKKTLSPFAGAGTSANPYQIGTAAQLAELAELVNEGYYENVVKCFQLTADIDLSAYGSEWNDGKGWKPIGNTHYFMGHFDGNHHKVSGLYINDTSLDAVGLFGAIFYNSTVRNLGVEGEVSGHNGVGGIVGGMAFGASLTNCYASVAVRGNEEVGGMVGGVTFSSSVANCYTTGSVAGVKHVGGVTGCLFHNYEYNDNVPNLTNCYATGRISGVNEIGGIAGSVVEGGSIDKCYALNPSIEGALYRNRVLGTYTNDVYLYNYAWEGMVALGYNTIYDYINIGAPNGGDITAEEAKTQKTYSNDWKFGNDDANPWKMGVGEYKLPVFFWQTTAPGVMPF